MSSYLQPQGLLHVSLPCLSLSLEFAQIHVHRVGDATEPSHPLLSPSPPVFNLSQHQGLFQCISPSQQVVKVLELQHQSFQWTSRTDFLQDMQSDMQMIHRVWPKQNLKIVFHCPRQMHSVEEGRFPHLQGLHQLMLDCFPGGSTHSGSNNLFQPSFIKMRPIMLHLGLNISCWTAFPYKHFL